MAHIVADRVRETSTTTGTGSYDLGGATLGFQDFDAACATGDTIFYFAQLGSDWEVGIGTFTAGSPDTLARTAIYASTNGGSAVSWGDGIKEITAGLPARFLELVNTIESTIASATTTDIGALQSLRVAITGTTTITSLGTATHKLRICRFTGALTLTHNSTTLKLPGLANITTQDGDVAILQSDESGNWRLVSFLSADRPIRKTVTYQVFASGSGTYNRPSNPAPLYLKVRMIGAGGGGAGSGTTPGAGGTGGSTTFSTFTAAGGSGGNNAAGGGGGSATGGSVNRTGGTGASASGVNSTPGGYGGAAPEMGGPVGGGGAAGAGAGGAGPANSGGGGGGGGVNLTVNGGGGGGGGGYCEGVISSPAATYSYAVGAAGTAGTTGSSGAAGGAGGSGMIIVEEHYY